MKFASLNEAYFEARFVKNFSIFEPQIEKHYAYKKKCKPFFYNSSISQEESAELYVDESVEEMFYLFLRLFE